MTQNGDPLLAAFASLHEAVFRLKPDDVLEVAASALSITGAVMNACHMKSGFLVWIFANVLWIAFGVRTRRWGLAATFAVFLVTCVIGLCVWE